MIFLSFWLIGIISGVISTIIDPSLRTVQSIAYNLLFYQITVTVTLSGLVCFIGQVFKSDMIADKNGWPRGNLFQKELGLSQIGWAFAGILSIWYKSVLWIGIIVIFCPMIIGAAIIHIMDLLKNKNHKPGNPAIIFTDLIIPITLIVLSIFAKIW